MPCKGRGAMGTSARRGSGCWLLAGRGGSVAQSPGQRRETSLRTAPPTTDSPGSYTVISGVNEEASRFCLCVRVMSQIAQPFSSSL